MLIINFIVWLTTKLAGTAFVFSVDVAAAANTIKSVINVLAWIVPMDTVATLVGLSFGLLAVRCLIALIKSVWDLIPML